MPAGKRGSGHSQHLATIITGQSGGNQRAGTDIRLHDQRSCGHAGNNAVAAREMLRSCLLFRLEFTEHAAMPADGFDLFLLYRAEWRGQSATEDGDGRCAAIFCIQRPAVGCGIDAEGHAADNTDTLCRKTCAPAAGEQASLAVGLACADHGQQPRMLQGCELAACEQDKRRIVNLAQQGRVAFILQAQDVDTQGCALRHQFGRCIGWRGGKRLDRLFTDAFNAFQFGWFSLPDFARTATGRGQQAAIDRADAGRGCKTQPGRSQLIEIGLAGIGRVGVEWVRGRGRSWLSQRVGLASACHGL